MHYYERVQLEQNEKHERYFIALKFLRELPASRLTVGEIEMICRGTSSMFGPSMSEVEKMEALVKKYKN